MNYVGVQLLCIASDSCEGIDIAIFISVLVIILVASQFSLLIILIKNPNLFSEQNYDLSALGEDSLRPIVMFKIPETFTYARALRLITSFNTDRFSLCLLVNAAVAAVGTVLYILPSSEWCSIIKLASRLIQ